MTPPALCNTFHSVESWRAASSSTGAYTVKSLAKALNILECLAEGEQHAYGLTQLSRRLRLHVSTVHPLLMNLLRRGLVEESPSGGSLR